MIHVSLLIMKRLYSVFAGFALLGLLPYTLAAQATAYSHGDPTDEEQLYLEFINRARANVDEEVARLVNSDDEQVLSSIDFFNVDLDLMAQQFEDMIAEGHGNMPPTTNTQMPLAFNPKLIEASRLHNDDMFISVFQGHNSSSNAVIPNQFGNTPGQRANHQGYQFAGINENVFASARSVWHGHAAFNIDWGSGPGGIQDPAGHRHAIHHPLRREAGVGVLLGDRDASERPANTSFSGGSSLFNSVGPQLVTQLFAHQLSSTGFDVPFLTGVIYADIDGDSFYSIHEGLADFKIEVDGAGFYARTSTSGGYAIPLPNQAGTYTITVSGPNVDPFTDEIVVGENLHNVKWDYSPLFTLPAPVGSSIPPSGESTFYNFGDFPGGTSYHVRVSRLDPADWSHGAEAGDGSYTTRLSSGTMEDDSPYTGIQSTIVDSGSSAFYLAHFDFTDQIITFEQSIVPSSTSQLTFQSRLGWAASTEIAEVQVSADGGQSWTAVYSQPGPNPPGDISNPGESSFNSRSASLSTYAGQVIQIRLNYRSTGTIVGGAGQLSNLVGWVVDSLTVTNSQTIADSATVEVADSDFHFVPPADGPYLLEAAPVNVQRVFPFGLPLPVTAGGGGGDGGPLGDSIKGAAVFRNEEDPETYFKGAASFTGVGHAHWMRIRGFGLFQVQHFPWIYHANLGYLYAFGPGRPHFYAYVPDLEAVCYTNLDTTFPYFYDFTNGHWWYFHVEGSTPQRRYYFSFKSDPQTASGFEGWKIFTTPVE